MKGLPTYENFICIPVRGKKYALLIALMIFLLPGCNRQKEQQQYVIGFSQCQSGDDWRKTMIGEMRRELSLHDNIRFIYKDAEANSQKQIEQIKELVKENIDLLIVSPNEVKPLSPIIKQVFRSGVPVVLIDRRTDSANYTAFVGASNFEVGQNAGRYAVSLLNGHGNLIEIAGLTDASPFIDRHNGFMDIISRNPGINHLKKIEDHSRNYLQEVENTLLSNKKIDLIFAHSDYIAKDIYEICKKLGLDKKIKIIGIDGLPIPGAGMDMVADKHFSATVLYPTGGQEAIITAADILEKSLIKKKHSFLLPSSILRT